MTPSLPPGSVVPAQEEEALGGSEPAPGAVLLESGHAPAKMLFLNSGVFLTTQGSPHLELLGRFVAAGTEIASCGTCLDYYGRREKLAVGTVGSMRDTVEAMVAFKIVRTV